MLYYVIVEQSEDNVNFINAPALPIGLKDLVRARIFPAGSDWVKFTNARSFRFTYLKDDYYMLSYTFILGKKQNEWNGTLRAWGIVCNKEFFLSEEGLLGKDPQQLFEFYKQHFVGDSLYYFMCQGLKLKLKSKSKVSIPLIVKIYRWCGLRLPYVFTLPFTTSSRWVSIESALYHHWQECIKSAIKGNSKPMTFTTFTLSVSEDTKIKGIPLNI